MTPANMVIRAAASPRVTLFQIASRVSFQSNRMYR